MKIITIMCGVIVPCLGSDPFDGLEERAESVNRGVSLLNLADNDTILSNYLDALTQARIRYQIEKVKAGKDE